MSVGEQVPATVELADLERWATDPEGPVALCLQQRLLPVEAEAGEEHCVIAPPTYASIGYNIDTLADGTRVALVDSVGAQANRMEPLFKAPPLTPPEAWLVPQIEVLLRTEACGECPGCRATASGRGPAPCSQPRKVTCSLLDLAHRAADAVVRSAPALQPEMDAAFAALARGDAGPLAALAPTSLLFGVWDSRGASGVKRPRLVRALIRAWDVDELHAAAQFNSVWKQLDTAQREAMADAARKAKVKLSEVGFADAPATHRQGRRGDGEARVLGGVLVRGPILRDVTVNLVALRALRGGDAEATRALQRYLFALALVAATHEINLFLREGCHLRYAGDDVWRLVPRRGPAQPVDLAGARAARDAFVASAVAPMRARWSGWREVAFDLAAAQSLVKTHRGEGEEEGQ
jgi:CRISPR-associated protein Csb1